MPLLARFRRAVVRLFLLAAALLAVSWLQAKRLPPPEALRAELRQPPIQGPTERAPFEFEYKGKSCQVRPVASYELHGLVVSRNDIHSFSDIYHDATSVDTRDLCVVWGANVARGSYREVEFWSGPFTCYMRRDEGVELDLAAVGNNHLITDDEEIRAALARTEVGDQVRLSGLLVDYRMDDWGDFWRRTSTVRDDPDCEVVFLDELEILERNAPHWHAAKRVAKALLGLLPIAWLAAAVIEARSGRSTLGEL